MDLSSNDVTSMAPEQLISFKKIIIDMMQDLITTFPELENDLDKDLYILWKQVSEPDVIDKSAERIFKYCVKVFPPCLLDILYQNKEMFTNTEINTQFLPGINYRTLMHENISESTRNTIWKYLQLILYSTVSNTSDADSFGDTADMFKSINKDDFKTKLEETLNDMKNLFSTVDASGGGSPHINPDNIPSVEKIQKSMESLMEGKIGSLAREIANETVDDFSGDTRDASNVGDVFSNLMKDPTKLMGMVKNVGTKLDTKIKSGEIKESELLSEASEMMRKMKEMPGMDNMEEMFKKMGLGGKGKINHGAMQAMMNRNMKMSRQKERMKSRIGKPVSTPKCADTTTEKSAEKSIETLINEIENEKVFRCGPTAERSSASDKKKKKKK
jgi:hypothetical protein